MRDEQRIYRLKQQIKQSMANRNQPAGISFAELMRMLKGET